MTRYMPLTGGLTVFFATVLIVLGLVLLSYGEVGSAVLVVTIGVAGLVLVPVGFWIVGAGNLATDRLIRNVRIDFAWRCHRMVCHVRFGESAYRSGLAQPALASPTPSIADYKGKGNWASAIYIE